MISTSYHSLLSRLKSALKKVNCDFVLVIIEEIKRSFTKLPPEKLKVFYASYYPSSFHGDI